ncbi:Hydroxymethylglutaryl-CoA synthase [Venturia inaequalis]|nr:Hydroxymethylglutaryl-CoA synthase [Venturia inaequalis]
MFRMFQVYQTEILERLRARYYLYIASAGYKF